MGYLLFESSESGFQSILAQVHDAISEVGEQSDGSIELEITVKGQSQKTLICKIDHPRELVEILKLNVD